MKTTPSQTRTLNKVVCLQATATAIANAVASSNVQQCGCDVSASALASATASVMVEAAAGAWVDVCGSSMLPLLLHLHVRILHSFGMDSVALRRVSGSHEAGGR